MYKHSHASRLYQNLPLSTKLKTTPSFAAHFSSKTPLDPYTVLDVARDATAKDIKTKYYEMSKLLHPDSPSSSEEDTAKFHSVTEAYEILGDETKRREYDRLIGAGNMFGGRRRPSSASPYNANANYQNQRNAEWRQEYENIHRDPFTGKQTYDDDIGDRQYMNFVRFQERMRDRKNTAKSTWAPNADEKFESFYRKPPETPRSGPMFEEDFSEKGRFGSYINQNLSMNQSESKYTTMSAEDRAQVWAQERLKRQQQRLKVEMPTYNEYFKQKEEEKLQYQRQNQAFIFCGLLAIVIIMIIGEARNAIIRPLLGIEQKDLKKKRSD